MITPPEKMLLRRDFEKDIFKKVYTEDEYKVKNIVKNYDIVFDLGANIGSFSRLALDNGAKHVVAVECWDQNYKDLLENCSKDYTNFESYLAFVCVPTDHTPIDSSLSQVRFDLGDLILKHKEKRILMKMDIEGWEYSVLYDLREKDLIKYISFMVGEFHASKTPDTFRFDTNKEAMNFFNRLGRRFSFPGNQTDEYVLGLFRDVI